MRNTKFKFLAIILCLFISAKTTLVFAGGLPAFDAPKVVGDLIESVSNFAKKVGEKMKDVQNKVMGKFIGKIEEAREYANKQKEKIEAEVSKAKADIDKEISEAKKTKEEAEAYKAKAEKAIDDKKIYMEYSAAKTQVSSIKSAYESSVNAQEENYSARVSSVDQNIETIRGEIGKEGASDEELAQLEASITHLELTKKNLEEENQKFLLSLAEERDAALVPAQAEVTRIEKELKDKGMSLTEKELGTAIDMKNPTAAIEQVASKAYVKEENTESVAEAKRWLRKDFSAEKIATLSDALRSLKETSKQAAVVSDVDNGIASGAHTVEGIAPSVTNSNDVRIEEAKALLNYNRQLINRLKLRTAEQLAETNISTTNEDQNLSAFSFDDYNYATQCKGVK